MFTEYHKIETPFERDVDGTKKLIEGKYRSKFVEFLKELLISHGAYPVRVRHSSSSSSAVNPLS